MIFGERPLPDDATFGSHDRFDRGLLAKGLTRLISFTNTPNVIALDGRWVAGKTFFLRLWERELRADGYPTIYLNAFSEDYSADAFGAIAGAILSSYSEFEVADTKERAEFRRKAANVARIVARGVATSAVKGVTAGIVDLDRLGNVADAVAEELGELTVAQIEAHLEAKSKEADTLADFQRALSELPRLISTKNPRMKEQLVFVIDELDRCRPSFALDLLEAIKHFFGVNHVNFVVGANIDALAKSVDKAYGYDGWGRDYLSRLLPFVVTFDDGPPDDFRRKLESYLDEQWAGLGITDAHRDKKEGLIAVAAGIAVRRGLTFREVERVMQNLALVLQFLRPETLSVPPVLMALLFIRNHDASLFNKLKRGEADIQVVKAWLGLDKEVDENNRPLVWLDQWINALMKKDQLADNEERLINDVLFRYNIRSRSDVMRFLAQDVIDRVWLS